MLAVLPFSLIRSLCLVCGLITTTTTTTTIAIIIIMVPDGLSLAMFEALRGLRDAVAPESGNLGRTAVPGNLDTPAAASSSSEPDSEELWNLYRNKDPHVVASLTEFLEKHPSGNNTAGSAETNSDHPTAALPRTREEFIRLHAKMEMNKDTELVMRLAGTVLEKSRDIDQRVNETIPGMHRTRQEQMQTIEQLMQRNQHVAEQLEQAFVTAKQRRDACRAYIHRHTSRALGIEEE